MSSGLTDDGANLALDHVLGLVDEVRLMTANGDRDTAGTEATGGSYAPATGATFAAATAGASSNTSVISYTDMPAITVVGTELWDSTGPTRLAFGALTTPRPFVAGDDAEFAIGDLDITLAPTA